MDELKDGDELNDEDIKYYEEYLRENLDPQYYINARETNE